MKKKEERNEKVMAEVMVENKKLSEPLLVAQSECDTLKKQVENYKKDKNTLENTKSRFTIKYVQLIKD